MLIGSECICDFINASETGLTTDPGHTFYDCKEFKK
jgi:hypothetical protein